MLSHVSLEPVALYYRFGIVAFEAPMDMTVDASRWRAFFSNRSISGDIVGLLVPSALRRGSKGRRDTEGGRRLTEGIGSHCVIAERIVAMKALRPTEDLYDSR